MSEVRPDNKHLISHPEDVLHLYQGAGSGSERIGAEAEFSFYDPATLKVMSLEQQRWIVSRSTFNVHLEPGADLLEVASKAYPPDQAVKVIEDTAEMLAELDVLAAEAGLVRCPFEFMPNVQADRLLENISKVPRFQTFFVPVREDMRDIARHFVLSKSAQVSVSYRDPGHLLENMRRLYFLAPFLFMLSDNNPGFVEGNPEPVNYHPGLVFRSSLGFRGGIPPHFWTAESGEDYIGGHIEQVMSGAMFAYFERDGTLVRLPNGNYTNFLELQMAGQELNTLSNYFLAQSTLWPDIKIAQITGDSGEVTGHRYEARMFGSGPHQYASAVVIVRALAFNQNFASRVSRLLKEFGFYCDSPASSRQLLEESYLQARVHGGRYFSIRYGIGTMRDFAGMFAEALEEFFSEEPEYRKFSEPLLHICRTGRTDAFANRKYLSGYEHVLDFLKNIPDNFFNQLQSMDRKLDNYNKRIANI